uniref:C-type lectin domain-containing protein n=1 Tax=Chrysemys picta bellii TaxID=8478 RepID=A0A8C3HBN9_CHRPI
KLCSSTYLTILFFTIVSTSLPGTEIRAGSCPRGWLLFQGNCYGYFPQEKTWMEAEAECQHHWHGTHLASIHSAGENNMMAHYIKRYHRNSGPVWIGLFDFEQVSARCPLCLGQPLPRPLGSVSLLSEVVVWGGGATRAGFPWERGEKGL